MVLVAACGSGSIPGPELPNVMVMAKKKKKKKKKRKKNMYLNLLLHMLEIYFEREKYKQV